MRSVRFAVLLPLLLAGAAFGQGAPVVAVALTGKPYFVVIDQLTLNINAVAGVSYSSAGTGTLTVTYLNGYTGSYSVKLTPEEWSKIQAKIVADGNK